MGQRPLDPDREPARSPGVLPQVDDVEARRPSAYAESRSSAVPSVEALSTTTIAVGAWVWRAHGGQRLLEEVAPVPGHHDGDDVRRWSDTPGHA